MFKIKVLGISNLPLSTIYCLDLGTDQTACYFFSPIYVQGFFFNELDIGSITNF